METVNSICKILAICFFVILVFCFGYYWGYFQSISVPDKVFMYKVFKDTNTFKEMVVYVYESEAECEINIKQYPQKQQFYYCSSI